MAEETYRLRVDCKNPACNKVLDYVNPRFEITAEGFATRDEAIASLSQIRLEEIWQNQADGNAQSVIHPLIECPVCHRAYYYLANEVFIKPPRKGKITLGVVSL